MCRGLCPNIIYEYIKYLYTQASVYLCTCVKLNITIITESHIIICYNIIHLSQTINETFENLTFKIV